MQQPPQGPYQPGYPQGQPYYPQQQPYYPPQPGIMQQPPPRKPRNRKHIAIGCGTLFLLFLIIGSCNAIMTGGKGIVNTDAPASQGDTSTVATMPPHATTASNKVQPPAPTTVPTHAVPTTVAPTQVPTQPPVPTSPPAPTQVPAPTSPPVHTGVNGNPWGYDFTAGNLIYNPPADFCGQYFSCVTTFWKSMNGYVAQCADGVFTHSGGVRGECSHNGGKGQILYSH